MGKIPVLLLLAATTVAIASRDVRSPGGSGWQASSSFGGSFPSGFIRSSGGSWAGSGRGLGRSADDGGWRGSDTLGSHSRNFNANGNPSNNGWSQSGYGSSGVYGGNSLRSSAGWNQGFSSSDAIESLDSSNGWYEDRRFRSNNGWQSSEW